MGNLLKREQIKMKISLTNQQKVFLTAQAATLKVPAQEKFLWPTSWSAVRRQRSAQTT